MDKVIVNIGGEELELRPISARQYLSARMEAEMAAETFGEDEISKAVLMGAGLLAKSLFFNNERLFTSIDGVLDALTAEEIVTTADYIDLEPDVKTKAVEITDKTKALSEEKVISLKTDFTYNKSSLRTSVRKNEIGSPGMYSDIPMRMNELFPKSSFSPRSDMRRVSDFFQRDSRRYDGIIVGY